MSAAVPAAVTTVVAVLALMTGTALASPVAQGAHKGEASHAKKVSHPQRAHHAKPKPKRVVELTGVLTDTPTATIAPDTSTATIASDTATSTITMAVKGGDRRMHRTLVTLTLNAATVIRRGDRRATAADLRKGDHLSVRARRLPNGSWLALRVNAAPRPSEVGKPHDD